MWCRVHQQPLVWLALTTRSIYQRELLRSANLKHLGLDWHQWINISGGLLASSWLPLRAQYGSAQYSIGTMVCWVMNKMNARNINCHEMWCSGLASCSITHVGAHARISNWFRRLLFDQHLYSLFNGAPSTEHCSRSLLEDRKFLFTSSFGSQSPHRTEGVSWLLTTLYSSISV